MEKKYQIIGFVFLLVIYLVINFNFTNKEVYVADNDLELRFNHDLKRGSGLNAQFYRFITKTGKIITIEEISRTVVKGSCVLIRSRGFKENKLIEFMSNDPIEKVLLDDLDGNGFDEIYLFTRSVKDKGKGDFYVFASDKDEKLLKCKIEKIDKTEFGEEGALDGYRGHDSFYFKNKLLLMEFPIYVKNDLNFVKSGMKRRICYNLDCLKLKIMFIE